MEKTPEDEAFDKACGYLSYRQRSIAEISRYLDKKGFNDQREAVIERLSRVGLLDDVVFAETWVRERSGPRGYGSRRLRMELARLGIDRVIVEEALIAAYPAESEADCAKSIAEQKSAKLSGDTRAVRQKIYALLIRRGFSPGIAKDAVEAVTRDA